MTPQPSTDRRVLLCLAAVIFAAAGVAHLVECDFGRVAIRFVHIPGPSGAWLAGKLYRPSSDDGRRRPGVLALHGYQNDKETMDSFAIELSRRGFVVLALDQLGHGDSEGSLDFGAYFTDPSYTMGAGNGYLYLKSLPFVDAARLGVIGHSMGAMTAVKVGALNPDHRAINSQCGPSGDPRLHNLLLTQARFEEFKAFRENQPRVDPLIRNRQRLDAFGLHEPMRWDVTYGDVADGSARRAALINTVHAGVTHHPKAVTETVEWLQQALGFGRSDVPAAGRHIYLWKELAMLVALLGTLASLVPLTNLLLASPLFAEVAIALPTGYIASTRRWWKLATINALIGGATFPLLTQLNRWLTDVTWLPLPMGNGVLLWFLGNAAICLTLFLVWFRKEARSGLRLSDLGISLGRIDPHRVFGKTVVVAALLFAWMYALEGLSERVFGIEFRFIWPFMRQFSPRRFGLFWLYLLPATLFFVVNGGVFLFGQARQPEAANPRRTLWLWWVKNLYAGLFGLLIVWSIQYVPYVWLGLPPGFEALGLPQYGEMWPLMLLVYLPSFSILLLLLTWFFRRTGRVYLGAFVVASLAIWFTAAGSVIGR